MILKQNKVVHENTNPQVKINKKSPKIKNILSTHYNDNAWDELFEIGVDEAGRGPMFGRLYVSAVILPKDELFAHEKMKDSKKFTSDIKIQETAEYIEKNALAWSVCFEEVETIDKINIRQSVLKCMHRCIDNVIDQMYSKMQHQEYFILVDGNDFKSYMRASDLSFVSYRTIVSGDNKYTAIAAASILAKTHRDRYIREICIKYPILDTYYNLSKNKGYGTAAHMEGIKTYGITKWHRKTYGLCKTSNMIEI
jgi:ribonuclease HII